MAMGRKEVNITENPRVVDTLGQCLEYLGYITLSSSLKVELAIKLQTAIMLVCLAGLP